MILMVKIVPQSGEKIYYCICIAFVSEYYWIWLDIIGFALDFPQGLGPLDGGNPTSLLRFMCLLTQNKRRWSTVRALNLSDQTVFDLEKKYDV